jgi:dienelactone hydrolase
MPNKRMGLALDAVHNVTRRYNIDPDRVYVSGMSGGGRMTCMTAVYYPEVFTGAVPIVGSLYFREVPVPDDPELRALLREDPGDRAVWPQRLIRPGRRALERMAATQRWVLLTGSEDFNMPEMRMHFEHGFERDGFTHAHYLEVPGLAHAFPDADWFGRAVALLDAPLNEEAGDGPPLDPRQQREEGAAQRRLDAAERLIDRAPDRALRLLRRVDELYPDTRAAARARELIAEIEGTPDLNGGGGDGTDEPIEIPEAWFIIE